MSEPTIKLPSWARVSEHVDERLCVIIEADTEGYLAEWLPLLMQGIDAEDRLTHVDQYWLECAYQCAKMDLQEALIRSDYDQRAKPAEFRFSCAEQWAMRNFPEGRGWHAATKQYEARAHFIRVRGRLP